MMLGLYFILSTTMHETAHILHCHILKLCIVESTYCVQTTLFFLQSLAEYHWRLNQSLYSYIGFKQDLYEPLIPGSFYEGSKTPLHRKIVIHETLESDLPWFNLDPCLEVNMRLMLSAEWFLDHLRLMQLKQTIRWW